MAWLALWIAGAAANALGFLMLALPSSSQAATATVQPTPFTPFVPYGLMLTGAVGTISAVIGLWRSRSRQAAEARRSAPYLPVSTAGSGDRVADTAALAGFVVAAAALLAAILAPFLVAGPCAQDASGFFCSTATERLALPLALTPGLISSLALAIGTRRYRIALSGLILCSLPIVGFAVLLGLNEVRFVMSGGFD